jgi:putative flippase GtrA
VSRTLARQGLSFTIVGLAATATHAGIAISLNSVLRVDPLAANAAAYVCGFIVSYIGNAVVTFGASVLQAGQIARFAAVSLTGFVINESSVFVGVTWLHWPLAFCLAPAIVLAAAATFVLSRGWAFQPKAQPASTASAPTLG